MQLRDEWAEGGVKAAATKKEKQQVILWRVVFPAAPLSVSLDKRTRDESTKPLQRDRNPPDFPAAQQFCISKLFKRHLCDDEEALPAAYVM